MSILEISAALIVLAGAFGVLNYFFLKLPSTIGITVIALLVSLAAIGLDALVPALGITETMRGLLNTIDFDDTLLNGMLGLLLFAGALHVRIEDLREQKWLILIMATVGILISTLIVGGGVYFLVAGIPFLVALVFGALISPTDPVAVLGLLKQAKIGRALETKVAGESLFNDGVGYVVFLILVALAFPSPGGHPMGAVEVLELFAVEVLGGALLGGVLGWITFSVMRNIDDYSLEVLLTLGLAMGGYTLATALHMSGPIMVVVAGLFIGNAGTQYAMNEMTREHVDAFWRLIDEILNAVLFLLIGLEVFALTFEAISVPLAFAAVGLTLAGRLAAVAFSVTVLEPFRDFTRGAIPIMVWGGLRGGISVALVLSLPDSDWKPLLLTLTYVVVVFSIIVQGLSVPTLAKWVLGEPSEGQNQTVHS